MAKKMEKNKRPIIFVSELNPLNIILLLLLSVFCDVFYLKKSRFSGFTPSNFNIVDLEILFGRKQMQLNAIVANGFDEFRQIITNRLTDFVKFYHFDGKEIDFTNQYLLELGRNFEATYLHVEISRILKEEQSGGSLFSIPPRPKHSTVRGLDRQSKRFSRRFVKNIFYIAELIWDNLIFLLFLAHTYFKASKKTELNRLKNKGIKVLWGGVNPQELEIADKTNSKFCFLNSRNLVESQDILYILPAPPSANAQKELEKLGIPYLEKRQLGGLISGRRKLYLVFNHLIVFFRSLVMKQSEMKLQTVAGFEYIARGFFEYEICRLLDIQTIISSNSEHETSGFKFSVCNSQNIRTISWQYSGIGTVPIELEQKKSNPTFGGRFVQSLFSASEVWVWDEKDKQILEERHLCDTLSKPQVFVTGCVMGGSFDFIGNKPNLSKRGFVNLGDGTNQLFWITVFDLPTNVLRTRNQTRVPVNRFTKEMQEEFFGDLSRLLNDNSDIGIVFKPKRREAEEKFFISEQQKEFLELANQKPTKGRVILLPHNIDPYLPFAFADAAIGAPFTSAIEAAQLLNTGSAYYDPLNFYHSFYPTELSSPLLTTYPALAKEVDKWLKGAAGKPKQPVADPQLRFRNRLLDMGTVG